MPIAYKLKSLGIEHSKEKEDLSLKRKEKATDKKEMLIGIFIISIMFYISSIISIVYGLTLLNSPYPGWGILTIIGGIIAFVVARGLLKRKQWARYTTIIIAILEIIIYFNIFMATIDAIIILYLLLNKGVRRTFY